MLKNSYDKSFKIYMGIIVLAISMLFLYLFLPIEFEGPGFSIKYKRFTNVNHEQIGDEPLNEAGEVIFERKNYRLQITYIHYVNNADLTDITKNLISHIETNGIILNKSETIEEKYNDNIFYTTKLIFSDGLEEANIIFSIHYNSKRESIYYLICSSKMNSPDKIMNEYIKTFKIK